ncbi:MAG: hypothetical protein JXQ90_11590 [Cyclobacteriaceae bacterium]
MSRLDMILKSYYDRALRRGIGPLGASINLIKEKIFRVNRKERINSRWGHNRYDLPLLMSFPRSGLNLIRYFLETVSGQPTPGQIRNVKGTNFIIDRAHYGFERINRYSKAILLIRNYKECLIREHSIETIRSYDILDRFLADDSINFSASTYGRNIRAFDEFDKPKLLLYYEDLITNKAENLRSISDFLELSKSKTEEFIENLEQHSSKAVSLYKNVNHDSATAGDANKLVYHSNLLNKQELQTIDNYYKTGFADIFNKYLTRYL